MRKLFFLVLLFCTHHSFAQLVAFDFGGIAGNEPSVASVFNAPGVQPSSISRGAGITASANADRFNSFGWTTNLALDATDYLEFTIAPSAGHTITVTGIIVSHQRSSTGPTRFLLRTDRDGFNAVASNLVVAPDVTTTRTDTFTLLSPPTISAPLTIRLHASAAESSTGSWGPGDSGGQDIIINGVITVGGNTVTTGAVSPLPVCISAAGGAPGTVAFTSSGTFNGVFSAYLSNASGSFASPLLVGSVAVNATNPSGTIPVVIPAGLPGGTGYRIRVDAGSPAVTGTPGSTFSIINGVPPVTGLTAAPSGMEALLEWDNPEGCFNEIMVVVKEGAGIVSTPSGDGSGYFADSSFQGNGTGFSGGKVVYKGTDSAVRVTNLNPGNSYYVKAFTRKGAEWSSGTGTSFTPLLLPAPGEILISQFSPDYDNDGDEYIELVNTTHKRFNLSGLEIRYQSAAGNPAPITGGVLNGTLPPFGFWLLSPNPTVTVGLTNGLARDDVMNAGLASPSGQLALVRSSDNVIIDAVGYGDITGGTFTEGSPAPVAPPNGGLRRIVPEVDHNNNSIDFERVSNASIELRNSGGQVLPVRFGNLRATRRQQSIRLEFSNLTESGIAFYSVERSSDGQHFKSLARLNPTGNNGGQAAYQYLDNHPARGLNIYRIKAVESNGATVYTSMVRMNLSVTGNGLLLYPNPASSELWLQVNDLPAGRYRLKIYNAAAQLVNVQSLRHNGGAVSEKILLRSYTTGMYTVEVSGAAILFRSQFLVH
jgi:hypothetical protein